MVTILSTIDVYYQWYLSDDEIIDRDPDDATRITDDELLAGITNVCTDWSVKYLHQPENWNPEADIYEYRNSLSPDDPNYEEYGADGLHDNPDYWSMKELHAYTTELRQNWLCIRPEYLEGLEEEELEKVTLSMGNNNPFAFNTDSCYIPEGAAGKYLYVKAVVVNAKDEYTKIYDQKQVFYSHPMLIIDPSMLIAETQEPAMDFSYQSGSDGAYVSKTVNATVGKDMLFGFTGIVLPESMEREFEVRLSQKVYDSQTGEVVYQADNGETINLKDFIFEPGQYYVEQSQALYYLKPYFDRSNNYVHSLQACRCVLHLLSHGLTAVLLHLRLKSLLISTVDGFYQCSPCLAGSCMERITVLGLAVLFVRLLRHGDKAALVAFDDTDAMDSEGSADGGAGKCFGLGFSVQHSVDSCLDLESRNSLLFLIRSHFDHTPLHV